MSTPTSRADRIAALPPDLRELLRQQLSGAADGQPDETSPAGSIRRASGDGPAPLSPAQERLWFLYELDPGSVEYNTVRAWRLRGELDVTGLTRVLDRLVARHEALRTTFDSIDGQGVQVVHPAVEVDLPVTDLIGVPDADSAVERYLVDEATNPFDLRASPAFRARLIRLGDEDHVLVLSMRHIVTDGWSMGVLITELCALYDDEATALPALPIRYTDFAVHQRAQLAGDGLAGGGLAGGGLAGGGLAGPLAYWREQLDGLSPLDLPTDRPRPAIRTSAGAVHRFEVPAPVLSRLRAVSRDGAATLFMTLAAAVQVLLSRYCDQTDVAVGTATSGRSRVETEGLVGFFVNTLVLRTRVDEARPFTELLATVRATVLDAFANDEVPFQRLVDLIRPERDPSRPALVEVAVNLHNTPQWTGRAAGLRIEELSPPVVSASMDLAFDFFERDGVLVGYLGYNTDLFTPETARRMAAHLGTLLAEVAVQPDRPLAGLSMVDDAEHRRLTVDWSGESPSASGCVPAVPALTAVELFAREVAADPSATALVYGDRTLSYAELDERSNRLARLLRSRGAGPERLVAVALPRSIDMVVTVLAVLKSGAAYLPLDPAYPVERLRFILDDATPVLMVTTSGFAAKLGHATPSLAMNTPEILRTLRSLSGAAVDVEVKPAHPAYVIYTSGSSGRPKAVAVTHTGVPGLISAQVERFGAGRGARVLLFASLSFDAAFSELGMAILAGGTLVVAGTDELLPGEPLAGTLARHRISHVTLPPTALAVLPADALPPETTLIVAGEACPPGLAATWCAGRKMFNAYGPTEATVCASMTDSLTPDVIDPTRVSIGRPMRGVRVYILDSRLRPVPAGVPGDLYLAGPALARGYLRRFDLTAERFVANPFGAPGERMYRTGDRARWLADGRLDFLGRADDQVKLRGFRIELGEIEAVLCQHDGVESAAATVWQDQHGTRRLVAYLVPVRGNAPDPVELRRFIRERVPEHLVPAAIVELDGLPRNANGKVDRRALPDPELTGADDGHLPPRTEVEKALARIWSELLGVDRVGVEDNFFDLGGDSILSLQVVSRARDAGLQLTTRQAFHHQTIAELAAQVGAAPRAGGSPGVPTDQPVTGDVPLTPIQHWFFANLRDSIGQFNQSILLELPGEVDRAALGTALVGLVAHHDALRLRVQWRDGRWRQYHASAEHGVERGQPLRVVDLTRLSPASQRLAMRQEMMRAQTGFDLGAGPLVRARLFVLGDAARLFLAVHHLAVDAVSWHLLLSDLDTAYRQASRGEPVHLGPKGTSLQRWSLRLREHTEAGGFTAELEHWRGTESAVRRAAALPRDADGDNTVGSTRTVTVRLSAGSTDALLRRVPEAYRTQINDVLLAALGRTLADWTRGDIVPVALEGHGRVDLFADLDLSRTVGWFTTLYPVALDVPIRAGWADLLKSVKEQLRAVPSAGLGYGALRYLAPESSGLGLGREPEVSFNYLGRLDAAVPEHGLYRGWHRAEGYERSPAQSRQQLIEVNGGVFGGELEFGWTYSTNVHREETIRRVAGRFVAALEQLIAHCAEPGAGGCTPSDFPLVRLDQSTVDKLVPAGRRVDDIYPLTPTQGGMLFHSLAQTGRDMYTGHFALRIDGIVDPGALALAWQRVVDRTPVLRTAVVWDGVAQPVQVVYADARVPVSHHDLRELSDREQRRELDRLWAARSECALDLGTAPLLRLRIARLSDTTVQLYWSTHHILVDGWSFAQLLADVFDQYAAVTGERRGTPVTRRPYRDYLAWLADRDEAEAEKYWRRAMTGFTGATPLPYDRPLVRAHGSRSSREAGLALSPESSRRLYESAKRARLTVNTVVQGAWAILLSRYSGEREVCFGATVAGRPADLPGAESIIGLFINTVPVRVSVDDGEVAVDWLRALQDAQLESRHYEYASLTQIQRWAGVPSGSNLFDSILVFENYPYDTESAARHGIRVGEYLGDEHTNYALTLTAHASDRLRVTVGYDPDLFDAATIDRLLGHLETLLDGFAGAPQTPVAELPILADRELRRVLYDWNDTAVSYPAPRCVPEWFAEQAAGNPDAIAVADRDTALSFAELEVRANRLAHRLVDLGVRPGVLVGVCVSRGVEAVVALLGVLKAGGAFVPLDPEYPAQRLASMLADAAVPVVVTEEALLDRVGAHPAAVVCLDRDRAVLRSLPASPPEVAVTPDDLAYVIYTSGTTGRPKGVMVEHRQLCHMVRAWDTRYGLTELRPRVLSVSSLSVDLFFADFTLSALFGATMVICPSDAVGDPVALADLLLDSGAQLLVTVPSLARALVAELTRRGQQPDALRLLIVGSEGWPADQAAEVRAGLPAHTAVVNAYGSTETTVDSTTFELGAVPAGAVPAGAVSAGPDSAGAVSAGAVPVGTAAFVPIGAPLANTRIYVLDRNQRPVPVGVVGECYIGGDGVSRGYLNRPELNAERFLRDPFSTVDGARLYRTGDLVRWRADGQLECLGRVDDQVKVRGFRIELGEVEGVLARHPQVASAAAATVVDESGLVRLVGYLVPVAPDDPPDVARLRAFVAASLPAPAVPSAFVTLDALPLNPSGTVNRRALPAPAGVADTGTPYVAPRDDTEAALVEIWADVLRADRIGVEDSFFDLGGDSILSIGIVSRIRARLGVVVSPRQLFDTPTIAALAQSLGQPLGGSVSVGAIAPGVADDIPRVTGDVAPLSFAQQRLWFLDDFDPGSTEYHVGLALRLGGDLDTGALRGALRDLVARHEPLRTTYDTVVGGAVQVVHPPYDPPLTTVDLRGRADDAVRRYLRQDLARPFDLRRGPVLRATLASLGERDHLLLLVVHHIATDGASMELIASELGDRYAAALRAEHVDLPPLPVRYADYAAWQRERLAGPALEPHLEYWRRKLHGIETLALPTDRPRPPVRVAAGDLRLIDVPPEVARGLRTLAREHDATLFMVLLSAVLVLLARYTGQTDIAVGTASSGRRRPELERLVGLFVNTVVLRANVDEALPFTELLADVRASVLEAFGHDEVPFERVVEAVRPARDPSRNPLVEVMVGLETQRPAALRLPGLTVAPEPLVTGAVSHDLGFDFVDDGTAVRAAISYGTALFEPETIDRMAAHLLALLGAVSAEPGVRPSALALPGAAASATGPRHEVGTDSLAELFQRQVRATPDDIALVCAEERLSFAELDSRANRLARELIARGIGAEDLVAVVGARNAWTVVSILAVLKAGAAYLPLDPEHPVERLGYLLRDAAPALVLGDRLAGVPALPAQLAWLCTAELGALVHPRTSPRRAASSEPAGAVCVIYTSGSTGRPKGVVIEERNLTNLFFGHAAELFPAASGRRLRTAMTATFAFDGSLVGLLLMIGGHELHLVDDLTRRDPEALVEYVRTERIDHLDLTPTYAEQLVDAGLLGSAGPAGTGHRPKVLTLAGEALGDALWHRLRAVPGLAAYNCYGPTECAVDTLYSPVGATERPVIGGPLWNTTAYLLDRFLRPVPDGVPGELYLSGAQLARGYLHRPELTAQRFVADPFGPAGGRMYRTGDVVRRTATGAIEYLGRADDQVKVRGYRIELGEVETVLAAHPSVGQASAAVREGPGGTPYLVGYVTPAGDEPPSPAALREYARTQLPGYQVPAAIAVLDQLPMTASGKVDRRALPEPTVDGATDGASAYAAPGNPVEQTLADIWAEVLGVVRVGVHDNFFDLGGDSIVSMQAVHRIRQAGLRVTSRQLFEHQTVAELATVVEPAGQADIEPADEPVAGPVPLTPVQREFFAAEPVAPHHLTQSVLVELRDGVDERALAAAVAALPVQHDALRMRFRRGGTGWTQYCEPIEEFQPLRRYDLSDVDPADRRLAASALAAEADASLDLADGPLWRALLFDFGTGPRRWLFVTAHHLVVDAVSWRILLDDLRLAYRQAAAGQPVRLGAKTTSYRRWAQRLADHAAGGGFDAELAYWTSLPNSAELPVDADGPRLASAVRTVPFELDERATEVLLGQATGRYRSRTVDILIGGLAVVLARWTGRSQVLLDLEGHGREEIFDDVDLSRTVGWFTSTYPVAIDLVDGDWPARIRAVRRQLRAVPGNGFGYGCLRHLTEAGAAALGGRAPAPVVFNYHGQVDRPAPESSTAESPTAERSTSDDLGQALPEPIGRERDPAEQVGHLLEVVGAINAGRLRFTLYYSANVHHAATIERVAAEYRAALLDIVAHVEG